MILKKAEGRPITENHFESVSTLGNKVLGFGTIGNLTITALSLHADPAQIFSFVHLVFLVSRMGVLQGLVHGIINPCLIKSSTVGESARVASDFSGY